MFHVKHLLLTVLVSYKRLPLLQQTLASYLATVSLPHRLLVIDNASDEETRGWLRDFEVASGIEVEYLAENRFPGPAANIGWHLGTAAGEPYVTLLHRSDNDVEYLPGWCDEVAERFGADADLWQLGLRTLAEEGPQGAVGGNCVLARDAWEAGVRYPDVGWHDVAFEDSVLSHHVEMHGKRWERVRRPCIVHLGVRDGSFVDYYSETGSARGI